MSDVSLHKVNALVFALHRLRYQTVLLQIKINIQRKSSPCATKHLTPSLIRNTNRYDVKSRSSTLGPFFSLRVSL